MTRTTSSSRRKLTPRNPPTHLRCELGGRRARRPAVLLCVEAQGSLGQRSPSPVFALQRDITRVPAIQARAQAAMAALHASPLDAALVLPYLWGVMRLAPAEQCSNALESRRRSTARAIEQSGRAVLDGRRTIQSQERNGAPRRCRSCLSASARMLSVLSGPEAGAGGKEVDAITCRKLPTNHRGGAPKPPMMAVARQEALGPPRPAAPPAPRAPPARLLPNLP